MLLLEDKAQQVDDLLDKMAEEVQLDNTRYEKMIQSYKAVREWLESDEQFFKPFSYEVYPHGSVRIFTTVKPIGRDEFDLDIVLHFRNHTLQHSPDRIYHELERRLKEHKVYRKLLEPKNRVLRLNYAGDFHMDIMPGIQRYVSDENQIKVPDRKLEAWVISNPRGYADWFLAKANEVQISLLEKALRAEEIQADDFSNKKPLQRAVQLIKRYRDIYFENDDTYKTRSIILTTLAGQFYQGEESIFDTVDNIISRITLALPTITRIKVVNPVNSEEEFTDKWDSEPEYYYAFKAFMLDLHDHWQELKVGAGVVEEGRVFKGLFGDAIFEKAQLRQSLEIGNLRKNNMLQIDRDTGILTTGAAVKSSPIKKNTFFGE